MTGMATPPPRATDCEMDGFHQRISAKTVTAPAAHRAMIRTRRRTSAPGYRIRLVQCPSALRSQLCVYSTATVQGNLTLLADEMKPAASGDSLAHPRISKIWPH